MDSTLSQCDKEMLFLGVPSKLSQNDDAADLSWSAMSGTTPWKSSISRSGLRSEAHRSMTGALATDSRFARLVGTARVQLEDAERGLGSSQSGVDAADEDVRR